MNCQENLSRPLCLHCWGTRSHLQYVVTMYVFWLKTSIFVEEFNSSTFFTRISKEHLFFCYLVVVKET